MPQPTPRPTPDLYWVLAMILTCLIWGAPVWAAAPVVFNFQNSSDPGLMLDNRFGAITDADSPTGKPVLKFDTSTGAEWNICAQTLPGFFEPGKSYSVRIRCRVQTAGEDSYLFLLIRPFATGNANGDLAQRSVFPFEGEIPVELKFTVPAGATNYAVQIHSRKIVSGYIKEISIEERQAPIFLPPNGPQAAQSAPAAKGASDFEIENPRLKAGSSISVADFGASPENPDNVGPFNEAIAKCLAEGVSRLMVPKGIYHFTSDPAVSLNGLKDFEFDGQGSTFIFLKKKNPLFDIRRGERVRLKNFKLDWNWEKSPLASLVKVEEIDPDRKWVNLRFIDYDKVPNPESRVVLLRLLDPVTRLSDTQNSLRFIMEVFKGRGTPKSEWVSGNLMKLYLGNAKIQVGQLFVMLHHYYDMSGLDTHDNSHLSLEDIHIYSCPGFGILGHGEQHHWQVLRTKIGPPDGVYRPVSSTGDHLHSGNSKGFFKMEGCDFGFGNDDFINIHDTSAFALKTDENRITAINTASFPTCSVGDLVELRNPDYSPSGFSSKIISVKAVPKKRGTYEMTFADPVPGDLNANFVLFNRRYDSGQISIKNCRFHNAPGNRIILIGHDITFENNLLEQAGPFKIETGYTLNSWCEGYGASNVVIRGNTFQQVNPAGRYDNELRPAIYMSTYIKNDPSTEKTSYPVLRDILVEGNRFLDCPGAVLFACSVQNLVVRNNQIENTLAYPTALPYRGALGVAYVSNIFITANTWKKSLWVTNPGIQVEAETSKAVYRWGNMVKE